MDPSAPDNNNQNPDAPQQPSPIQPGQYVVASADNLNAPQPQTAVPMPSGPVVENPQVPQNPQMTQSYNQNPAPAKGFTAAAYQNPAFQTQVPPQGILPQTQPDPTPFTPPGTPVNQVPASPNEGSKFGKIKILGIALGVISLLVIIGALVWFFVLNKETTQQLTTANEEVIEEPSPANQPPGGFSQLPESTQESSPQPPTESAPAQTTPPAQ